MKDIRKEIIKLHNNSTRLREISKDKSLKYDKVVELNKKQNEVYKKYEFYKNFVEKRGELKNVKKNDIEN